MQLLNKMSLDTILMSLQVVLSLITSIMAIYLAKKTKEFSKKQKELSHKLSFSKKEVELNKDSENLPLFRIKVNVDSGQDKIESFHIRCIVENDETIQKNLDGGRLVKPEAPSFTLLTAPIDEFINRGYVEVGEELKFEAWEDVVGDIWDLECLTDKFDVADVTEIRVMINTENSGTHIVVFEEKNLPWN